MLHSVDPNKHAVYAAVAQAEAALDCAVARLCLLAADTVGPRGAVLSSAESFNKLEATLRQWRQHNRDWEKDA